MVPQLKDDGFRPQAGPSGSLEQQALMFIEKNGSTVIPELYDALSSMNPSLTKKEVTELVWRLSKQGKAFLEDVPPVTWSLSEYLRQWDQHLWLYLTLAVTLATVLVVYVLPTPFPFIVVRWMFGSVFVIFIPGYAAIKALFPRDRELGTIERFALSLGLSLMLVPLVGLILSYTVWAITLSSVISSLTVLTAALSGVAFARQYKTRLE